MTKINFNEEMVNITIEELASMMKRLDGNLIKEFVSKFCKSTDEELIEASVPYVEQIIKGTVFLNDGNDAIKEGILQIRKLFGDFKEKTDNKLVFYIKLQLENMTYQVQKEQSTSEMKQKIKIMAEELLNKINSR